MSVSDGGDVLACLERRGTHVVAVLVDEVEGGIDVVGRGRRKIWVEAGDREP